MAWAQSECDTLAAALTEAQISNKELRAEVARLREALNRLLCEATAMLYTSQTPWEPTYAERMAMDALTATATDTHEP